MSEMVVVSWTDSTEAYGWVDPHNFPEIAVCRTVGFLVHEDNHQIVLAASEDQTNGNSNGVMAIPKSAISARQVVRLEDGET